MQFQEQNKTAREDGTVILLHELDWQDKKITAGEKQVLDALYVLAAGCSQHTAYSGVARIRPSFIHPRRKRNREVDKTWRSPSMDGREATQGPRGFFF
jgi:hypothetical protein